MADDPEPRAPAVTHRLLSPVREFLHDEAAGGTVLSLAAAVALVWANSGASDSYERSWR